MFLRIGLISGVVAGLVGGGTVSAKEEGGMVEIAGSPMNEVLSEFCMGCHDSRKKKGDLDLETLRTEPFHLHGETWEKVLSMLAEREMPPEEKRRPDEPTYEAAVRWLETALNSVPGRGEQEDPVIVSTAALVNRYCLSCHGGEEKKGGLNLEAIHREAIAAHPELWEKVAHRLQARQMPPPGRKRPPEKSYEAVLTQVTGALDAAAEENPNPGRTETFRRLNRTEYENAIRDLLALEIDGAALLPTDEASHGFDNVTVGGLSPTLLDRYITAAQKISRLAVGTSFRSPGGDTIRIRPDLTQEEHVEGLPLGTRGGAVIPYTFPQDGEYEIRIRLARDRNEEIEGLQEPHQLEVLLDREHVESFTVAPPRKRFDFDSVDENLRVRVPVEAGPHRVGVTFVKKPSSLLETKRQPYEAHFNRHRHPRQSPAIYQVSITGPYEATGVGDTPSRKRLFVCQPDGPDDEEACAERILSNLMRRAYRRPVSEADLARPMEFFKSGQAEGGFEAGIETALSAVLVSPEFLFRIERDPADVAPGSVYEVNDFELASRLSFFLWSSIPDDALLDAAERGDLQDPERLEEQVRRMLKDERASSLVSNFGGQWLYLRNLESFSPNLRLFPDFDDNLRQALRRETELFFEDVVRVDRSVLQLLKADYTFLNERLAKHYNIPHIYGSRFRQVALDEESKRGGLLRQGSVLAVTSYATRTSPVIRGNWILENILGTPPPPPPPDVPALEENTVASNLSVRERLTEHRANKACAACHDMMDPVGFSLENFDAVGRWREVEDGRPIDASGGLPDGREFVGVEGLEEGLLDRPELFVRTLTEKLLTFGLGRGVEYYDGPALRRIVEQAEAEDYRFSAIVLGIVKSEPFRMRKAL